MRRLVLFTLVALAPSYVFTHHGGGPRPPVSAVRPPAVTYVTARHPALTIPIPALQRPDVSGSEGYT
jgi:hypothetical protein